MSFTTVLHLPFYSKLNTNSLRLPKGFILYNMPITLMLPLLWIVLTYFASVPRTTLCSKLLSPNAASVDFCHKNSPYQDIFTCITKTLKHHILRRIFYVHCPEFTFRPAPLVFLPCFQHPFLAITALMGYFLTILFSDTRC